METSTNQSEPCSEQLNPDATPENSIPGNPEQGSDSTVFDRHAANPHQAFEVGGANGTLGKLGPLPYAHNSGSNDF